LERISSFFVDNAGQLHWIWLPDGDREAVRPHQEYFEVWLTHSFLEREVSWLKARYPAAHVSVRVNVAGETKTLTRLAQPPEGMAGARNRDQPWLRPGAGALATSLATEPAG
jgi:hypothetical protein